MSLLPEISGIGKTLRMELRLSEEIEDLAPTDLRVRSREDEIELFSPEHFLPCLPAVIKLVNSKRHFVQKKSGERTPVPGCVSFRWSRSCFFRSSPVHGPPPLFPLHDWCPHRMDGGRGIGTLTVFCVRDMCTGVCDEGFAHAITLYTVKTNNTEYIHGKNRNNCDGENSHEQQQQQMKRIKVKLRVTRWRT
jgi:hypothetical protein